MASFTKVEEEIILESNEDVAWLPQVLLTLRDMNPDIEMAESFAEAASIVRSVIEAGYVELCREKWSTPPQQRSLQPLRGERVSDALGDEGSWVWDDSKDEYFVLNQTQKGREAFFELISKPS